MNARWFALWHIKVYLSLNETQLFKMNTYLKYVLGCLKMWFKSNIWIETVAIFPWCRIIHYYFYHGIKQVYLVVFKSHASQSSQLYLIHHQVDVNSTRCLLVTWCQGRGVWKWNSVFISESRSEADHPIYQNCQPISSYEVSCIFHSSKEPGWWVQMFTYNFYKSRF